MRLIDADTLQAEIEKMMQNYEKLSSRVIATDIMEIIEVHPTAFDLESVIKQLNENKEDVLRAIKENSKSEYEMIKIKDLKELFEEYTQEQIDIIKSNIKGA